MDKYFNPYREMISLRGISDHTLKSYCTYIRSYLEYLPFVPTQQETFEFINTIPDIKQKAMVALMYSSGLRIGEVCHLRYGDINRTTMKVHILYSQNRMERFAPLSELSGCS